MNPTEDDLRQLLKSSGYTRLEQLGEFWGLGFRTVLVGASEIVVVDREPYVIRRFNRAIGGLQLAMKYLKENPA